MHRHQPRRVHDPGSPARSRELRQRCLVPGRCVKHVTACRSAHHQRNNRSPAAADGVVFSARRLPTLGTAAGPCNQPATSMQRRAAMLCQRVPMTVAALSMAAAATQQRQEAARTALSPPWLLNTLQAAATAAAVPAPLVTATGMPSSKPYQAQIRQPRQASRRIRAITSRTGIGSTATSCIRRCPRPSMRKITAGRSVRADVAWLGRAQNCKT